MCDRKRREPHEPLKLYGRRKGKRLSDDVEKIYQRLDSALSLQQFLSDKQTLQKDELKGLYDKPHQPLWLEIGFGGGEHLIHQALLNPDVNFIGIEPFYNGMARLYKEIDAHHLKTIRTYDDDAGLLLARMPDNSLDRAFLLYPDPWHKKRHWKRRFVSKVNINHLSRVLKSGGLLRIASDIPCYINWTMRHLAFHPDFKWQAHSQKDWQTPWQDWIQTRYEAKALREGRTPTYLSFVRI